MTAVLSIKDLSFAYQDAFVLKNVSLDVHEGQFFGIIGPNGGGKTTLLKLILGFLQPNQGTITVFGKSPVNVQQQIAYVPQALHYDREFPISVLELVLQGRLFALPWYGIFSKKDKVAAFEALESVKLSNLSDRPIGSLSGGQLQRALIARALASHPKLLILDEPTTSVDAKSEADIYSILKDCKKKMTIMMVTHNLQAAIELFEGVVCIQQTATLLNPREVCEHFALGLYHTPLIGSKVNSMQNANEKLKINKR